ncbi:MAG TPA: RNA pseudouridine synthase, partial [Chthoniobacteraceae bacterium]|nr:RNA pseudouridine synthase [Chthoniobacteraceae bacterium]
AFFCPPLSLTGRFIPPHIRVVDEAPHWIVVEKPAHLLVHPTKPSPKTTLWDELRGLLAFEIACGGQVSIINRLDRETSGLTLVAKDGATASAFCKLMEQRRIHKEYLALTWGWPTQDDWTVDAPLLRLGEQAASRIHLKQAVHPLGAAACTRFRVEQRFENARGRFAVVRAWPETGRLHQIRVHLAHSGYAVVGDKIYGPDEGCYLEFIETGWTESLAQRLLLPRHALHSASLQIDGLGLQWSIGLPDDLATFADHV